MPFSAIDHDEIGRKILAAILDGTQHTRQGLGDHGVVIDTGNAPDLITAVTEFVRKFAIETHLRSHGLIALDIRDIKTNNTLRDTVELQPVLELQRRGQ